MARIQTKTGLLARLILCLHQYWNDREPPKGTSAVLLFRPLNPHSPDNALIYARLTAIQI
jgi:hypothetical protein